MLAALKKIITLRGHAEMAVAGIPSLMIEADKIANSIHHGEHARRKSGTGVNFWQFRDYESGDRPQDIDWRQSGKTDHIYIRQKEMMVTRKTYLWCASYKGMDFTSQKNLRSKHETAQILTLAIAIAMTRAGEQVGYFGDLKTGHNDGAIRHIGAMLAGAAPDELPPVHDFILPRNASFVAVGDFLISPDALEETIKSMAGRGANGLIVQVLDPAEIEFSFQGRIQFEGVSAQDKEIIDHIPSVRDEYQVRINTHIARIEEICARYGWHYCLHRTDTPPQDTMQNLWHILQRDEAY